MGVFLGTIVKLKSDVDRAMQRDSEDACNSKDINDWFTFTLKKKSLIEAVKQYIHILLA